MIALLSPSPPVPSPPPLEPPGAAKEFAVAAVNVCAGPAGSQEGPGRLFWSVVFSDGTTEGPSLFDARTPGVSQLNALAPNQCARGFVTFAITTGAKPRAVRYTASLFRTYEWSL